MVKRGVAGTASIWVIEQRSPGGNMYIIDWWGIGLIIIGEHSLQSDARPSVSSTTANAVVVSKAPTCNFVAPSKYW
jgi:hypothetical protein